MEKLQHGFKCQKHKLSSVVCICAKKQCQIPICLNCINEHNNFHFKEKTSPNYIQINNWYFSMKKSLEISISNANSRNTQIKNSFEQIKIDRQQITNKTNAIKNEIFDIINEYFVKYQEIVSQKLNLKLHQYGINSVHELQLNNKKFNIELQNLNNSFKEMNQQNYLQIYNRLKNLLFTQTQYYQKHINLFKNFKLLSCQFENEKYFQNIKNKLEAQLKGLIKNGFDRKIILEIKDKNNHQSGRQNKKNVNWAYPLTKQIEIQSKHNPPLKKSTNNPLSPRAYFHSHQYDFINFKSTFPNKKLQNYENPIQNDPMNQSYPNRNQSVNNNYSFYQSSSLSNTVKFSKSNSIKVDKYLTSRSYDKKVENSKFLYDKITLFPKLQNLRQ